ncbi:MAG TPA: hypothetical protein VK919_01450 [Solirubrobacterales bacterium]|nr:hypothetical protein [Solirubrobacterales bacterium]
MPDQRLPANAWERDERTVGWVYGSILTGAATVAASATIASKPWQVPVYTAATMIVVWVAHAYAAFVGHGGRLEIGELEDRLRHAAATELPVLLSSTPALAALGIAWLVGADVSVTGLVGLLAAIATMAALAAGAARRTGAGTAGVAAAGGGAVVLGALLIGAKVLLK